MFRMPIAIATALLVITIPFRPESALAQHGGHGGGGHGGGHFGGHVGGGFGGHSAQSVVGRGHSGASFSGSGVHYRSRFQHLGGSHGIGSASGLGHGRRFAHGRLGFGFGFGHGLGVGIVVRPFPLYSFWNSFTYPYYTRPYYGAAPRSRIPDDVHSGIPVPGDRIAVPGRAGSDSLVIEQLTDSIVRLTWRDRGREVAEVGLFLADSERRVITLQTLADPPFAALFEPASYATMAGVTVVWPDGRTSTTLVEYRRSPL